VHRDELSERYLAGVLDEAEREAFEEHFFECERCLEELETLRAAQQLLIEPDAEMPAELRLFRPRKLWVVASGIAAALAVIGVSLTLLTPKPELPAELLELATIEAPSYTPIRLRGAADEAQQRFRTAMEFYSTGDYLSAIPGLEEAAALDPNAPNISFYLGATYLMTDRTPEGVETLQRTVELGDTPYLEEALLLLAKAHLSSGKIEKARDELGRVLELDGDFSEQARTMLEQIGGKDETTG
jgi:tetratricopeptide (TPR) repeat protein